MSRYADDMESRSYDIRPEDDNYGEELAEVARLFRSFSEVMDEFLQDHGYDGDIADAEVKAAFLKARFREAGIPAPRGMSSWFRGQSQVRRKTAYLICFAFHLNVKETEDFFRVACLGRGFDCHYIREAIYYYAFCSGLSFQEAQELIRRAPEDDKGPLDFESEEDILYTASIIDQIDRSRSPEELLDFFRANYAQFGYNNATAYRYIRSIWDSISRPEDGLAARERKLFLEEEDPYKGRSDWDIYLQILGIHADRTDAFGGDRSLKKILKNNAILHPMAEEAFPDREGINRMLRGVHVSHEKVRKAMILLTFYQFWVTRALAKGDGIYAAEGGDADRCQAEIDRYLVDSGYPELYPGNPYDWIFLHGIQDDYPLPTLRGFMNELFLVKQEEAAQSQIQSLEQ